MRGFLDYAMIELDGRKLSIRFMADLIAREYRIEIRDFRRRQNK